MLEIAVTMSTANFDIVNQQMKSEESIPAKTLNQLMRKETNNMIQASFHYTNLHFELMNNGIFNRTLVDEFVNGVAKYIPIVVGKHNFNKKSICRKMNQAFQFLENEFRALDNGKKYNKLWDEIRKHRAFSTEWLKSEKATFDPSLHAQINNVIEFFMQLEAWNVWCESVLQSLDFDDELM